MSTHHPRALVMLILSACTGLSQGVYTGSDTRYRVGELPGSWQLLRVEGNDLTWLSRDSAHTLAVNATCKDHDDPTLEVLTRHLLMGFTARAVVTQSRIRLDGREALRTHVRAQLDGVPVELLLVVLKKGGCVYDFTYLSPVGRLEERASAFEQLLANFKVSS